MCNFKNNAVLTMEEKGDKNEEFSKKLSKVCQGRGGRENEITLCEHPGFSSLLWVQREWPRRP